MSFGPHDLRDFFSPYGYWGLSLLVIILIEHVTRINHIKYSPSWLLWTLTDMVRPWFETLGRWLGYVSSFYTYLYLGELWQTLLSLFWACWDLITSPIYMVVGYVKTMNLYDHPFLIVFGTWTLFMVGLYTLGYDRIYHFANEYGAFISIGTIFMSLLGALLLADIGACLVFFTSSNGDKNVIVQSGDGDCDENEMIPSNKRRCKHGHRLRSS